MGSCKSLQFSCNFVVLNAIACYWSRWSNLTIIPIKSTGKLQRKSSFLILIMNVTEKSVMRSYNVPVNAPTLLNYYPQEKSRIHELLWAYHQ